MSKEIRDNQTELTVEGSSIQLLAHDIHVGYGGSDFDNWLRGGRNFKV